MIDNQGIEYDCSQCNCVEREEPRDLGEGPRGEAEGEGRGMPIGGSGCRWELRQIRIMFVMYFFSLTQLPDYNLKGLFS